LPSVVPSSTAMAIPRKPDPLGRETSKQQQSVRLPANWRRRPSNFAERLSRYCREVEQSFVKDCRGFLQSRGQSRSSSRGLD
jgi:hypothetical protein